MAKKSSIENNQRRMKLVKQYAARRTRLKAVANDEALTIEERFEARLKLSELPRNSAAGPRAQPLRSHRPSARRHRQVQVCRASRSVSSVRKASFPALSSRAGEGGRSMSMNDPLGDMLTRIRNAQMRRKSKVIDAGIASARPRARRP